MLTTPTHSRKHLSPPSAYYIRKLLRQNLDQLTVAVANGAAIAADPLSDLNAAIERLYPVGDRIEAMVNQLERLAMFHQTASAQGAQHRQQLLETEAQIFSILGYRLVEPKTQLGSILVIDQSPTDLQMLIQALSSYQVHSLQDGAQALAQAHSLKPDLILLDIEISGMDGYTVCQLLKSDAKTRDIPIIFISALNDAADKVKAFNCGAADYIAKPFQSEEVVVRVEHQLNLRKLQRRLEEQNVRLQDEMKERQQVDERYRSIVENSIDGIFQTAPDGHFISANPALAKIYGYESPEALIQTISNIADQLYVQAGWRDRITNYLQDHDKIVGASAQVYRRDGKKIWISENVRAVRDPQGHLLYYEGTVRDITERKRMESELRHQRKKIDGLLCSVLPRQVAERLKTNREAIAETYDDATVLFADVDNFTAFSSRISPTEQVKLLNELFSEFDDLVEQLGLEKIKVIRDVYMVAGGVNEPNAAHAHACATLALAMQTTARRFQTRLGEPFQLRIGMSTGAVISGVIGTKKFSYDLWGDTVNLASRMQSMGMPDRIQVTPSTYRRLHDRCTFEERGMIEVFGVGKMMTHWLVGEKATS